LNRNTARKRNEAMLVRSRPNAGRLFQRAVKVLRDA
jgi:hypothetical protein